MKSFTPLTGSSNSRVFLASLLTCIMLAAPLTPIGFAATNTSRLVQTKGTTQRRQAPAKPAAPLNQKESPVTPNLAATDITAQKVDTIVNDTLGDGKAQAGDTIEYTVTLKNNSTTENATGVVFNDTIDPNTSLVSNSIHAQPQARNDSYHTAGNTLLEVGVPAGAAPSVNVAGSAFDNDANSTDTRSLQSAQATSANGGTVTFNSNGTFTYLPPVNFTGTDTFTYTLQNDADTSLTDTATVSINVANRVWYVNNALGTNGDGRSTSPFNALTPTTVSGAGGAGDADSSNDYIYLFTGGSSYAGGIPLESGQQLVGNGVALVVPVNGTPTTLRAAGARPTIVNTGGNAVTLASNTVLQGFNVTAASNAAILGSGVSGTINISDVNVTTSGTGVGVSLTNQAGTLNYASGGGSALTANSSGTAVFIDGGNGSVTFSGVPVSQTSGRAVDIQNKTGGTVTFNNGSTVNETAGTTDAVVLRNNTGGTTITFSNNVTLTTSGRALQADNSTGVFTLNMTAAGNTLNSTANAAADIEDLTANLTFTTTSSANSVAQGLRVNNTTGSISFGTTNLSSSAGTAALLTSNASTISFSAFNLSPDSSQRGLHATGNTGTITTTSGTITASSAAAVEIVGTSASSRTPLNMVLTTVNANGGANGLILTNTSDPNLADGQTGGFDIAGSSSGNCGGTAVSAPTVADCTGGTIQNTTDDGIRLTDAQGVSFTRVRVTTIGQQGIQAVNLGGTNGFFNSFMTAIGGTGADRNGIDIRNSTADLTLFVAQNSYFSNSDSGTSFVNVIGTVTADMRLDVTNSVFEDLEAIAVQSSGGNTEDATNVMTTNITGNVFRNATANGQGGIIVSSEDGMSSHAVGINNNTFFGLFNGAASGLNAGMIALTTRGGLISGTVNGNTIGNATDDNGDRRGIEVVAEPDVSANGELGSIDLIIDGNVINRIIDRQGIFVDLREDTTNSELIIRNNNMGNLAGFIGLIGSNGSLRPPIDVQNRGETTKNLNLLITGNNITTHASFTAINVEVNTDLAATGSIGINSTVTNNTVNATTAGATNFIGRIRSGDPIGANMCVNASGNNLEGAGGILELQEGAGNLNVQQTSAANLSAANNNVTVVDNVFTPPNYNTPCAGAPAGLAEERVFITPLTTKDTTPPVAGETDTTTAAATTLTTAPASNALSQTYFIGAPQTANAANNTSGVRSSKAADARATRAKTSEVQPMNSAFPVNIGTLVPTEQVVIKFRVTVNNGLSQSVTQVSNQGQVTSTSFGGTVLTDDPSEGGTNDPTVTPILPPPTININNASIPEPLSGTARMPFSVTLSTAYGAPISVNFSTADGSATAPGDYISSSGTVDFAAGETLQTISVAVNPDGDSTETDETFTTTLSAPTAGSVIGTGVGTGTITAANPPGTVLISEVRTSGPNGVGDDFVELYNNSDATISIAGWALVKSGATCASSPVIVAVIPAATSLPPRGHYLIVGPDYNSANFNGTTGNATVAAVADIETDSNLALFDTSNPANFNTTSRRDAVGFGGNADNNCALLREGGSNLLGASGSGSTSQYSFARKLTSGLPQDTNDSPSDFQIVSTTPATAVGGNLTPALGAPGPENLASPIQRNAVIKASLIDGTVAATAPPNRVRSSQGANPTNAAFGTLSIQRRFRNTLAVPVTRLRFRVVDLTTINNRPAGAADLRVLSSNGQVRNSAGTLVVTVTGLTLEGPPQPNGGGLNSTLTVIPPGGSLAAGSSIDVQFLLGVQEQGNFSFFVNVEALPAPPGISEGATTKTGTAGKQRTPAASREAAEPKEQQ